MLDHGSVVTLTPAAAAGSVFAGWSGACSGTGPCTVTLDADRAATARFEPARQRLSLALNGSGRVTSKPAGLDCRRDCQREFAYGTSVRLTPAADRGWRFLGWRGACAGAKAACTLSMTQARSTTAVFVRGSGVSLAPAGQRAFVETASAKRDRPRRR
jgi:endoglucanase